MQLSVRALSRRDAIGIIAIALASMLLLSKLASVQSAAPQVARRSFEIRIPSQVPLKVKIKTDKEEKALDVNNKNWFRDIEIEVTNTSDKPIYFLSLDVLMPDVLTDTGVITTFPLRYGRPEFYEQDTKPIKSDVPIEPKATYTFVFEEDNRVGYEAWRAKNKKRDPQKLEVWLSHLSFGDGSGFTSMSAVRFSRS